MESLQNINKETVSYNEDEIKAQEKLNQRREARRRKILENAKNRLDRLNGRATTTDNPTLTETTHINGPNHLDSVEFSDPEVEPDITPQQMLENEPLVMGNIFSSLNAETTIPQRRRHILLRTRTHLIISALVASISTIILWDPTSARYGSSYSVFIPAGLCVVIDLLFFREQKPLNPIINLILTMCNVQLPSHMKNILHIFSIIQNLFIDLGVFMFSFCIFSCGLVCMNYRLFDLIIIK